MRVVGYRRGFPPTGGVFALTIGERGGGVICRGGYEYFWLVFGDGQREYSGWCQGAGGADDGI